MDIVYKTFKEPNEPTLTFKKLSNGEIFYLKDDEDREPILKIDNEICVVLKWSTIYHIPLNKPVGRIKGYFYVEEIM